MEERRSCPSNVSSEEPVLKPYFTITRALYTLLNFISLNAREAVDLCAISWIASFWVMTPFYVITIPAVCLATWSWLSSFAFCFNYAIWYQITKELPITGGFSIDFCRKCWPWSSIRDYFSHKIIKTAELPPNKNYIMGSHPHGALAIGGTLTFLGKVSGFSQLFPGLETGLLTLDGQFRFPIRRETALYIGELSCYSSSKESLKYLMTYPGHGRAVTNFIGGLSESMMSKPGQYNIKLMSRKGFIREALLYGHIHVVIRDFSTSLVPCFHFGELQLFDQHTGVDEQRLKNMMARMRRKYGFCPPLIKGRSIFGSPFGGILPFRRPLTSVIGAPINVERVENPTQEQIDELHATYCKALCDLFEEHKGNYDISPETHLRIF